jgi:hypothetical protein
MKTRRRGNNLETLTKMDLKEIFCDHGERIHLAKDTVQLPG